MNLKLSRLFLLTSLVGVSACSGSALAATALDPSFGDGGIAQRKVHAGANGSMGVLAGARLADGSLVLVTDEESYNVATSRDEGARGLVRFTAIGAVDSAFGTDGRREIDRRDLISLDTIGIVQQGDGKLVVASLEREEGQGKSYYLRVRRLLADGTADTSVEHITLPLSTGIVIAANTDMDLEESGAAIVITVDPNAPSDPTKLVRINLASFSLDAGPGGFGPGEQGMATITSERTYAGTMPLPGGGYLVASESGTWPMGTTGVVLRKITANGSTDASFGTNGATAMARPPVGAAFMPYQAALSDGKTYVAGSLMGGSDAGYSSLGMAVGRFNLDGTLDTGWGVNGWAVVRDAVDSESFNISMGDMSVVGGVVTVSGAHSVSSQYNQALVLRFTAAGILDASFDDDGIFVRQLSHEALTYRQSSLSDLFAHGGAIYAVGHGQDSDAAGLPTMMRLPLPGGTPLPPAPAPIPAPAAATAAPAAPAVSAPPAVPDADGDGARDNADCAPTDAGKPARGVEDGNCNGVDDAVDIANARAATQVLLAKLRKVASSLGATLKSSPSAVNASSIAKTSTYRQPVHVSAPSVINTQFSANLVGNRVVAAGGGNLILSANGVVAAGGGNLIRASSGVVAAGGLNNASGVVAAGGLNNTSGVVAAGGLNLMKRAVARKPKQVLLGGGGVTFKTAGKGALKVKLNPAGKKVVALYRAQAKAQRRAGKKVAPLRITMTTVIGPVQPGTGPAVYKSKVLIIRG